MIYAGIDPGKVTAIAAIDKELRIVVAELISPVNDRIDAVAIAKILKELSKRPCIIGLEKAQAYPGQGVVSMFNYGATYGGVIAIIESNMLRYELISPRRWQTEMLVDTDKSKKALIDKACRLWPEKRDMLIRPKYIHLVHALMIALYLRIRGQHEV